MRNLIGLEQPRADVVTGLRWRWLLILVVVVVAGIGAVGSIYGVRWGHSFSDDGFVVPTSARMSNGARLFLADDGVVFQRVTPPVARSAAALQDALSWGVRTWNSALADCSAPKLKMAKQAVTSGGVRRDGRSVVVMRTGSWCPDDAIDEADCYAEHRMAITHLYPNEDRGSTSEGEVREADIEVNAVHYRWSLDGVEPGTLSLRAALTHEVGHVLGLAHSCVPDPNAGSGAFAPCDAVGTRRALMSNNPMQLADGPVITPHRLEAQHACEFYTERRQADARMRTLRSK